MKLANKNELQRLVDSLTKLYKTIQKDDPVGAASIYILLAKIGVLRGDVNKLVGYMDLMVSCKELDDFKKKWIDAR